MTKSTNGVDERRRRDRPARATRSDPGGLVAVVKAASK
jgi:hypothetical protein